MPLALAEDEAKRVAETLREMSSALQKLSQAQSGLLNYSRKVCHYVRISGDKIDDIRAKAMERQE